MRIIFGEYGVRDKSRVGQVLALAILPNLFSPFIAVLGVRESPVTSESLAPTGLVRVEGQVVATPVRRSVSARVLTLAVGVRPRFAVLSFVSYLSLGNIYKESANTSGINKF